MRPELITALEAISEGIVLLRAGPSTVLRAGNPHHKGSGPGGGQFTTGGGSSVTHGKGYAARQRRRKRKLEKLRQKGHATIATLKAKHAKERKSLREKHRKEGASYSDRSSQSKALRATHKAESRQTVDTLKKEARQAFPKSRGQSSKAKEYRERVEKGSQKLGAIHAEERGKMEANHAKERGELSKRHESERQYTRDAHAEQRSDLIEQHNEYHREDARHIIGKARENQKADHWDQRDTLIKDQKQEWRDVKKEHRSERRELATEHKTNPTPGHVQRLAEQKAKHAKELSELKQEHKGYRDKLLGEQKAERAGIKGSIKGELDHNRETHSGRLKDALHSMREDHAEERGTLQEEHAQDRRELAKSHHDIRQHVAKAHRAERKEAASRLKQEIQGRSYDSPIRDLFSRATVERDARAMATAIKPRFAKHRVHKANSAEAILQHMLRQRGWTHAWRRSELSGKQHLNLLEDVRQYGRMYLRHEAESFFDRYGVEIEEQRSIDQDDSELGFIGIGSESAALLSRRTRESDSTILRGIASRAAGALSRFFDRARGFIREVIVAGAMALKGEEPLTDAELFAVDRLTKKQVDYLDKFQREVIANPPKEIAEPTSIIVVGPPPMTPGQFIARLESYGNAPWEVQNVGREVVRKQQVFKAERRVHLLSMAEHRPCKGGEMGCLEQSQLGWQPIGTLREIGDCFCMNNCDCYFEWQDPKGKIHVSPWGRHNPKGFNQPGMPGAQLPGIEFPSGEPAAKELPSGPGPQEKPPRKIKIKPRPEPKVAEPEPLKPGREWPNVPTKEELLNELGVNPDDYETI